MFSNFKNAYVWHNSNCHLTNKGKQFYCSNIEWLSKLLFLQSFFTLLHQSIAIFLLADTFQCHNIKRPTTQHKLVVQNCDCYFHTEYHHPKYLVKIAHSENNIQVSYAFWRLTHTKHLDNDQSRKNFISISISIFGHQATKESLLPREHAKGKDYLVWRHFHLSSFFLHLLLVCFLSSSFIFTLSLYLVHFFLYILSFFFICYSCVFFHHLLHFFIYLLTFYIFFFTLYISFFIFYLSYFLFISSSYTFTFSPFTFLSLYFTILILSFTFFRSSHKFFLYLLIIACQR